MLMKMEQNNKAPYYLAPKIKQEFRKAKNRVIHHDEDRVWLVCGLERSGKSKLARQFAYECDPTFCLEDICFDAKSFAKRIRECKKNKSIIFDEAFRGLSSRGALSKNNRELIQLLMEAGQKNLFIFIVLPSYFLLEIYVALFRSRALYLVFQSKKNPDNRFYKVYNRNKKRLLFTLGKKFMSYKKPQNPKKYRFYPNEPPTINEKEYNKKKMDAFISEDYDEQGKANKFKHQRDYLIYLMHYKHKIKYSDIEKDLTKCDYPIKKSVMSDYGRAIAQNLDKQAKNEGDYIIDNSLNGKEEKKK